MMMSNNPVYGYCKAGCKVEVVTEEEYEASKIRIVDQDGNLVKTLTIEVNEETGEMNLKLSYE
jgi:hypothetical protein